MSQIKKKRTGIRLDMTPMVDVAFLLLTFFMLTTTFRPLDDIPVNIPESKTMMKIPASDKLTISITDEQSLWLTIEDPRLRTAVFQNSRKINQDIKKQDLQQWISKIQIENMALYGAGRTMQVVLKADRRIDYELIHDVIETLRTGQISTVYFMTNPL
jgi:biopolymer transport protein ExbD